MKRVFEREGKKLDHEEIDIDYVIGGNGQTGDEEIEVLTSDHAATQHHEDGASMRHGILKNSTSHSGDQAEITQELSKLEYVKEDLSGWTRKIDKIRTLLGTSKKRRPQRVNEATEQFKETAER